MKKNGIAIICIVLTSLFTTVKTKDKNMNYKNVYVVILAGGNGTRLWPLSRSEKPKQFLAVGENRTLLDQAIDRIKDLVPKENIWISTTKSHEKNILLYVGDKIGGIIVEPGSRNTGPAILLSCMEIEKINPKAAIVFLPSDPFISDKNKFVNTLKKVIDFTLDKNHITLIGLNPTYPATGYGYIEFDKSTQKTGPFPVVQFHEKPSLKVATKYVESKKMLWNLGMFSGKASVFIDEFKRVAPEIFEGVYKYVYEDGDYNTVKSDSIDYAVMEKSNNIYVQPSDFPWCDVGNIEVFLSIQNEYSQLKNNVLSVESKNNLISVKNKLVALVGIQDLCIVETDDTLLIIKKDQAEKVKLIVNKIKNSKTNKQYI